MDSYTTGSIRPCYQERVYFFKKKVWIGKEMNDRRNEITDEINEKLRPNGDYMYNYNIKIMDLIGQEKYSHNPGDIEKREDNMQSSIFENVDTRDFRKFVFLTNYKAILEDKPENDTRFGYRVGSRLEHHKQTDIVEILELFLDDIVRYETVDKEYEEGIMRNIIVESVDPGLFGKFMQIAIYGIMLEGLRENGVTTIDDHTNETKYKKQKKEIGIRRKISTKKLQELDFERQEEMKCME
jgi:hypothetical protein